MRTFIALASIASISVGGCYSPGVAPCRLHCSTGGDCPSDLACNDQQMCASSKSDVCSPDDSGTDTTPIADARIDAACGWTPSNVDACALNANTAMVDYMLPAGQLQTISTDDPITTSPPFPSALMVNLTKQPQLTAGSPDALVFVVRDLSILGSLTIQGRRPLIILVARNVVISDTGVNPAIRVISTASDTACPGNGIDGEMGMPGTFANGGGGGGYSTAGANGGAMSGFVGFGGPMFGTASLTPLVPGCMGGSGGASQASMLGGLGGNSGGALQISALGRISVDGTINAGGLGGRSGSGGTLGSAAGGGGSGGSILLEAPVIGIAGKVCANGGSGGGASTATAVGSAGSCTATPAPGGGVGSPNPGGAGSGLNQAPGPGVSTGNFGGGGGGAAAGRIRFNGTVSGTGLVVPPASVFP